MQLNRTFSRRAVTSLVLLCSLALVPLAHAQKPETIQAPPEANEVVRITTELVQTDVMVFDQQGRFVEGLQPEQFDLRVDGKAVPISFFERVTTPRGGSINSGAATKTAATASVHSRGRRIVFFLDDMHLASDSLEFTRKALLQFIEGEMKTDDEVAIVSASGQVGFLQQFSNHKSVLRAAVARLKHRSNTVQDTEGLAMTEYVAMRIAEGDRNALDFYVNELLRSLQFYYSLPKYGGKSGGFLVGSESDQAARMVMQRAQSLIAQSSANSVASLNALESFLRSSSVQTGRKVVFFISDGFLLHGDAALSNKLQRITDAAARAGSLIYTVDARSLTANDKSSRTRVDALGRLDKFNSGEQAATATALSTLANNTGGRALLNFNTLDAAVTSALKETFNYYLLAWRPESESQKIEKFRQVEISVKNRPELQVRMSRGYLEADAKARLAQAQSNAQKTKASSRNEAVKSTTDEQNAIAATASAAKQSLPTRLSVGFLNTPSNGTVLAASTQIAVDALAHGENDKESAAIDLAGVVLNDQGSVASSFQTRLNVEPLPAERRQAENSSVIYNHRVQLAPGIYQVRVAAREAKNGRVGHARQWIEIPDLAAERLTLSTLFLGGQMIEAGTKRAGETASSAPQMQFSVDHRFQRASRLSFFVFVYNAPPAAAGDKASSNLMADIRVMQGGQALLTLPPQRVPIEATTDLRRIPYGGSFPLNALAPGRYHLLITITDRSTQTSASQQIEFEIE